MTLGEKPLYHLTIHEAQQLIQSRRLSPVELTGAILKRIESVDGRLHAYLNLMADRALAEARVAEAEILKGEYKGPLHGIPVAVKDQLDLQGAPALIRGGKGPFAEDATAAQRLRQAGAVLVGKLDKGSPISRQVKKHRRFP